LLVGSTRVSLPAPSWAGPSDQLDPNLVVQFTSPAAGSHLNGAVWVEGFAGDRRSTSGSGITENDVQLYLDAPGGQADLRSIFAVPGTSRNEELDEQDASCCDSRLAAALVFRSPWSTCTFPPGRHTLTAWVSSRVVPGAQNRADLTTEAEACPPGEVLFQDDLSSGGNRVQLDRPVTRAPGGPLGATAIRANFAVGLDARCSTAEVECHYMIAFRSVPGTQTRQGSQVGNSEYQFGVSPAEGIFWLDYWPPGEDPNGSIALVPDTTATAIHRGTDWNRLVVIANGPQIRLFVNGEQVGETTDDRRPWGDMRWGGGSQVGSSTLEVQFRNLVVSTVGDIAALAPVLRGR
jgi:hypothetical protein